MSYSMSVQQCKAIVHDYPTDADLFLLSWDISNVCEQCIHLLVQILATTAVQLHVTHEGHAA